MYNHGSDRFVDNIRQDTQSGGNRCVASRSASGRINVDRIVRAGTPVYVWGVNSILDLIYFGSKFEYINQRKMFLTSVL